MEKIFGATKVLSFNITKAKYDKLSEIFDDFSMEINSFLKEKYSSEMEFLCLFDNKNTLSFYLSSEIYNEQNCDYINKTLESKKYKSINSYVINEKELNN